MADLFSEDEIDGEALLNFTENGTKEKCQKTLEEKLSEDKSERFQETLARFKRFQETLAKGFCTALRNRIKMVRVSIPL
jgi:hypothetical protein